MIETLRIQVNSQILILHDSHHSSNTVMNLIFFEMLEWQKFEIEKIKRSDSPCLFRITDLEDQVFTANQSDINIYSIQKKILNILTAAKSKSKSKSKSNFKSTDFSNNNKNNNEIQKKRLIYKIIQTWYQCLEHLNADNIIQLFKDSWLEIKIKKFKFLSFCEACKLAESKKKISHQSMQRFK